MQILQARILEWVTMPSSRGSSQPRGQTQVSHIAGRFLTIWAIRETQIHLNVIKCQHCTLPTSIYNILLPTTLLQYIAFYKPHITSTPEIQLVHIFLALLVYLTPPIAFFLKPFLLVSPKSCCKMQDSNLSSLSQSCLSSPQLQLLAQRVYFPKVYSRKH